MPADLDAVHKTTAVQTVSQAMHVMVAQHLVVCVYVLVVAKAEAHAVGQLLAVTITVLQIFVVAHVIMTLQFVEHRVLHTNHGVDTMHGIIWYLLLIAETDHVYQEHTAVSLGWVAI